MFIFGICIMLVIPLGCRCGQEIERINAQSIEKALQDAETADEIVQSIPQDERNKNVFEKVGELISSIWKRATNAYDWIKEVLNSFLKAVAVMLVTTIGIPTLIVFAFAWLVKYLTKGDFIKIVAGLMDGNKVRPRSRFNRRDTRQNGE